MTDTFKCARCDEVFEKVWSDEEAVVEAKANGFSVNSEFEELRVLCNPCYIIEMYN